MKKIDWKKARFAASATEIKNYPTLRSISGTILPEIAVAGRSNVGKSSLLNHLFTSKDLVKTSSRPGKTQLLNFFVVDDAVGIVDLPGYGYADVPLQTKKKWGPMIQEYLRHRESLTLVLFLLDIRRIPNEDDLKFLEWAAFTKKPILLVLTKTDKITQGEKARNTKKILELLPYEGIQPIHYTINTNEGKNVLQQQLSAFFQEVQSG